MLAYVTGSFAFGVSGMNGFLVPLRAQELHAPAAVIGLLVGVGSLVPGVLAVPFGAIIDRFGTRRSFVAGTGLAAIVAALFAVTDSYWLMLPLQGIWGVSRNLAWIAAQTYVTGLGTPVQQPGIAGRFSFASNVGLFVAPLLAGVVAQAGSYQLSFWLITLLALMFIAPGLALAENRGQRTAPTRGQAGFGVAARLLRVRTMRYVIVLTLIRLSVATSWTAFFPIFLERKGFSAGLIGVLVGFRAAVAAITTLSAGPLARRAPKEVLTGAALALGTLGLALSPRLWTFPVVVIPLTFLGIGGGVSLPMLLALVRDSASGQERGVAMGVRNAASRVAAFGAPIVTGLLVPPLGLALTFGAGALVCWGVLGSLAWTLYFRGRPRV